MASVGFLWWPDSEHLPTFRKLLVLFLSFEHSSKGWKLLFSCGVEKKGNLQTNFKSFTAKANRVPGKWGFEINPGFCCREGWDSCQLCVFVRHSQAWAGTQPAFQFGYLLPAADSHTVSLSLLANSLLLRKIPKTMEWGRPSIFHTWMNWCYMVCQALMLMLMKSQNPVWTLSSLASCPY